MSRIAFTLLVALVSPLLLVGTAEAGKVIVLAVAGDRDGKLEDGLMTIVEDRHDLVTSGEAERAARRQGIEDLDGPALGKLARKLGADAVIEGSVSREDEGFLLVVRIRGKNGKTVKKISVDLPKPRLSAKARRRLGTGILDGIDRTLGIDEEEELELEEEEAPRKRAKAKAAKQAKAKKARKKARRAARDLAEDDEELEISDEETRDAGGDDEEDAEAEGDEDAEDRDRVALRDDDADVRAALGAEDEDEAGPAAAPRAQPAIRVALGPSAKMRTLAFTSRDFEQAPLGYKSSMVPGARLAAEAYPLAMTTDSMASGLGVGIELDQTIGLTTRSSDAEEVKLPTEQKHWSVGARFRIPFGKKPGAPTATLGVGYGRRVFIVDRGGLPDGAELDMPDVDYRYFDPGVAFRVPVGDRLALRAGGKALLIKQAGEIQLESSYGGAKITGLEADAGFEIQATPKIIVDLAGSFTQIGYAFVGNGQESNNRDLDPDSQDVGGASDRYIGLVGTIGYVY